MKNNKLFVLVALLFSLSLVLVACGGSKTITISNNGSVDYCELMLSQAGTEEYGENQLPEGETVTPGNKFEIPVTESGDYEVKIVACDGAGEQVLQVNVP